jgi:hypothetical protein
MAFVDLERERLYSVWKMMHRRCNDPRQPDYPIHMVVVASAWIAVGTTSPALLTTWDPAR